MFFVLNLRINQKNQELSLKAQQQAAETRQAQLFKEVLKTWESYEFMKIFQKVIYNVHV